MDFITALQAVSQFHEKLDELQATAAANREILEKLQKVLDVVMDQLQDFSNKYQTLVNIGEVQGRLNQMLIDVEAASSHPLGAPNPT